MRDRDRFIGAKLVNGKAIVLRFVIGDFPEKPSKHGHSSSEANHTISTMAEKVRYKVLNRISEIDYELHDGRRVFKVQGFLSSGYISFSREIVEMGLPI